MASSRDMYQAIPNNQLSYSKNLIFGRLTGIVGSTLTYPIDLVKTCLKQIGVMPRKLTNEYFKDLVLSLVGNVASNTPAKN
jgi:hypothetical protein